METISEILRSADAPPASFEEYLDRYADKVGDLVNEYIPRGTAPCAPILRTAASATGR